MRWAERNHWHLGWHAPDWSVRQAIGLEAPLGVAVAALLRDARGATGRPYTLTVEPGARTLWVGLAKSRHGTDPRWVVSPGTLRMELGGWARQAGYQLIWHAPTDYRLTTHAVIRGRFVQAASILVRSLDQAGSALHLTVYRKNRVIVVSASA